MRSVFIILSTIIFATSVYGAGKKNIFDTATPLEGSHLAPIQVKPIMIQFWASWCHRCSSLFNELAEFTETVPDLKYVTVSIDEDPGDAKAYLKRHSALINSGEKPPFLHDSGGKLAKRYGITTVPEIILLNAEGHLISRLKGHISKAELFRLAQQIKAETKGESH